jgi:hypothetical protein
MAKEASSGLSSGDGSSLEREQSRFRPCLGRTGRSRTSRGIMHRGNFVLLAAAARAGIVAAHIGHVIGGIRSGMTAPIHGRGSPAAPEPRSGTRSDRGRATRSAGTSTSAKQCFANRVAVRPESERCFALAGAPRCSVEGLGASVKALVVHAMYDPPKEVQLILRHLVQRCSINCTRL